MIAIRLTEYGAESSGTDEIAVPLQTLTQKDLSLREVQTGLQHLTRAGLLNWQGEDVIRMTSAQRKLLTRFYEEE
jgi:hypothetical protein